MKQTRHRRIAFYDLEWQQTQKTVEYFNFCAQSKSVMCTGAVENLLKTTPEQTSRPANQRTLRLRTGPRSPPVALC